MVTWYDLFYVKHLGGVMSNVYMEKSNSFGNFMKLFTGKVSLKYSKERKLGYLDLTGLRYGWCTGWYFTGNVTNK